jgi:hypothetical protein
MSEIDIDPSRLRPLEPDWFSGQEPTINGTSVTWRQEIAAGECYSYGSVPLPVTLQRIDVVEDSGNRVWVGETEIFMCGEQIPILHAFALVSLLVEAIASTPRDLPTWPGLDENWLHVPYGPGDETAYAIDWCKTVRWENGTDQTCQCLVCFGRGSLPNCDHEMTDNTTDLQSNDEASLEQKIQRMRQRFRASADSADGDADGHGHSNT